MPRLKGVVAVFVLLVGSPLIGATWFVIDEVRSGLGADLGSEILFGVSVMWLLCLWSVISELGTSVRANGSRVIIRRFGRVREHHVADLEIHRGFRGGESLWDRRLEVFVRIPLLGGGDGRITRFRAKASKSTDARGSRG